MKSWVTKNGYRIEKVLGGRSNVFLLTNKDSSILIDTSPEFMWKTLWRRLSRLGITRLDGLILTHSHFDHAANAKYVKEKYGAKVIIQSNEAEKLSSGINSEIHGMNLVSGFIVKLLEKKVVPMIRFEPCTPDIIFEKSYDLSEFGFKAFIMHTPGHTAGSSSLIIDDEIALVGDTMFGVFRWTAFPPFGCDRAGILKSWERLLATGCRLFIPSHGSANSRPFVEKDLEKRRKSGN